MGDQQLPDDYPQRKMAHAAGPVTELDAPTYKHPRFAGKVEISDSEGRVFLRRWYLLRTRRFTINLHHILAPDPDRVLHDHPRSFVSFRIWRSYVEEWMTRDEWEHPAAVVGVRRRMMRFLLSHRATDLHRIIVVPPRGAWTLLIGGRDKRKWGFATPEGWRAWDEYDRTGSAPDG